MSTHVKRRTVDLSSYPDLVVIYLGMRVNRITGIKTLLGFGLKISASAAAQPDGLLRHETLIYSLFPMHIGMRQYWRDADSLLKWTRSDPHRQWWEKLSEGLRRNRLLARNLFPAGRNGSYLRRCVAAGRIYDLRTRCAGPRPNVRCCRQGRKEFESPSVLSEKELYDDLQHKAGDSADSPHRHADPLRPGYHGCLHRWHPVNVRHLAG